MLPSGVHHTVLPSCVHHAVLPSSVCVMFEQMLSSCWQLLVGICQEVVMYLLCGRVRDCVGEFIKLVEGFVDGILIQVKAAQRMHNTRQTGKHTHSTTYSSHSGAVLIK